MNHKFLGGNNPRTEVEEVSGVKGDPYTVKNRSNSAYVIRESDKALLSGNLSESVEIDIHYEVKKQVPKSVTLVPDEIRLSVREKSKLNYKLEPEGDYEVDIEYVMTENEQIANVVDDEIIAREIGFGVLEVRATGDGFNLSDTAAVIIAGVEEE